MLLEQFRRLKWRATGLEASLSFLLTSRRFSRKRSASFLSLTRANVSFKRTDTPAKKEGYLHILSSFAFCLQLFAKLQTIRSEITDLQEAHIRERQDLEQVQEDLTKELKLK